MSIVLEEQSLATLKEWAHALGIRGMSNARKSELIGLLSQVGEARIRHAMELTGGEREKPVRGRPRLNRAGEASPKTEEKEEANARNGRTRGGGERSGSRRETARDGREHFRDRGEFPAAQLPADVRTGRDGEPRQPRRLRELCAQL